MTRLREAAKRVFVDQRRGRRASVTLLVALAFVPLAGIAALAVDVGLVFAEQTRLRAATDAAALTSAYSASSTTTALAAAQSSFSANNWSGLTPTVTLGVYCADPALAAGSRFVPNATTCTGSKAIPEAAVRVVASSRVPIGLARLFVGTAGWPINAAATAAVPPPTAGFSMGTGLFDLDTSNIFLVGQLLSGLLGTSVNLNLASYQGLASVNLDALSFLNALAVKAQVSVGAPLAPGSTFGDLAGASISVGDLVSVAETVLEQNGATVVDPNAPNSASAISNALGALSQILGGNALTQRIPINEIIDLQPYLGVQIPSLTGQGATSNAQLASLAGSVNVYGLLAAVSAILNANKPFSIPSNGGFTIGLPSGLPIGLSLTMNLIPPPVAIEDGPVGTSVQSTAINIFAHISFDLQSLTNVIPLVGPIVKALGLDLGFDLPLGISIAHATATLTNINCARPVSASTGPSMTVSTQPGIVTAGLASYDTSSNVMTFYSPSTVLKNIVYAQAFNQKLGLDVSGFLGSGSTSQLPNVFDERTNPNAPPPTILVGDPAASNPNVISCAQNCLRSSSNGSVLSSIIQSITSLSLQVDPGSLSGLPFGSPLVGLVNGLLALGQGFVSTILQIVASVVGTFIDPILGVVLKALGINLGYADTIANAIKCSQPGLVQ